MTPTTDEVLDVALRSFPEVRDLLAQAHDAAWSAAPARLLDLARLRVAQLLGDSWELAERRDGTGVDEATIAELTRWPHSPRFDATDRAALAIAEQFVMDVASMTDTQVRLLADLIGDPATNDFVNALLVIEQRQRMRLAWTVMLPDLAREQ